MLAGTVPLGQVPDELPHLAKASSLLHCEWLRHREMLPVAAGQYRPAEGVIADPDILATTSSAIRIGDTNPEYLDPVALRRAQAHRFQQAPRFLETGAIAGYFPLFYIPGAASLLLAKLTGHTPFVAFLLVRIVNLGTALLMGSLAVMLATRGSALLFVVLALPTSLSLAASANQDGLLISATALAVALTTRLQIGRPAKSDPCFWLAAALLAAIALAKPPYLPLSLMLLLPLRASGGRQLVSDAALKTGTVVAIAALVAAWTMLVVHNCATPVYRPPAEAGPLWPGARPAIFHGTDFGAQLSVLAARPWIVVTLPLHTIAAHAEIFFQTVGLLGWLNFIVPRPVTVLWIIALAVAAIANLFDRARTRGDSILETALLLGAIAATALLIYASQYLSFTQVGAATVDGVQGRYLLPLLVVVAAALPGGGHRWNRIAVMSLLPAVVAAFATFFWLPRATAAFYYGG